MIVLGCDPGLASFGVAVYDIALGHYLQLAVFTSSPSPKKRRVLATEDNVRRCRELTHWLANIIMAHNVQAICTEAMSIPRAAGSAWKLALSWGVLTAAAGQLPWVQASPQAIKHHVTGDGSASKLAVQEALVEQHSELAAMVPIRKSDREHAFDAAAAVQTCLGADVLRALRGKIASV